MSSPVSGLMQVLCLVTGMRYAMPQARITIDALDAEEEGGLSRSNIHLTTLHQLRRQVHAPSPPALKPTLAAVDNYSYMDITT